MIPRWSPPLVRLDASDRWSRTRLRCRVTDARAAHVEAEEMHARVMARRKARLGHG